MRFFQPMSLVKSDVGKPARREIIDAEFICYEDPPPSTPNQATSGAARTPPEAPQPARRREKRDRGSFERLTSIASLLLAILLVGGSAYWIAGHLPASKPPTTVVQTQAPTSGAPTTATTAEMADMLPIIARCESGGRQFDDEGNLITNATTTAVGKYQIMASLHEEKAKGLGFDIRTEQGNEAYAKYLYAESGTKDWEASRWCWEDTLMALKGLPPSRRERDFRVTARKDWSEPIRLATGLRVTWMPEGAATYELMTADGKVVTFPAITEAPIAVKSPLFPWFKFRVVDANAVVIHVVATEPRI